MLNLAGNLLFNHALNTSGGTGGVPSLILSTDESFPRFMVSAFVSIVSSVLIQNLQLEHPLR
jgi:hypothetical protein